MSPRNQIPRGASATRCWSLLIPLLTLLATAHAGNSRENPHSGWMPSNIDWDTAKAHRIEVIDGQHQATAITLKRDKPYRLIFDNRSHTHTHELSSNEFFHAVVLERMNTNGADIVTPHIHSLRIQPEHKVALFLVPKHAGEYAISCTLEEHHHGRQIVVITVD